MEVKIKIYFLFFKGWPEDALERVAREYLTDVDVEQHIKEDVVNISKYFHVSAR